ncbi:phage virion morphogenesis protein [Thermodesulfovibrio sp.]|uniref:phage virion morphogenesis protein n=1 Tax=Thermodesulfovibrio sp. TaxID=2067987 RepID=UPI003095CB51
MIKITVDDSELKQLLNDLVQKVSDRRPLMKNLASIMHNAVEENFEQEGRPRWKPSQRVKKQGGKTLQDTGSLAASITTRYDNDSAVVGTNKVYAAIHQFGGKAGRGRKVTIPERPYLKLTNEDLEDIKQAVKEYLI